jgi:PKD repeat protein
MTVQKKLNIILSKFKKITMNQNIKLFGVLFFISFLTSCKKDPILTPGFSFDATNNFVGCPIKFTDSSTVAECEGGITYSWDFGDGNSSKSPSPEYTYQKEGKYDVVLTITCDKTSESITQSIEIKAAPPITSSFKINSTEYLVNKPIQFENTSIGATKSEWNFGDGGTSTETSPTHTFTKEGEYNISLKTFGTKGTMESSQKIKVVNELIAGFDIPNCTLFSSCEVAFINTSVGATSYLWSFGDGGTSTEENPSYMFKNSGNFKVTLKIINGTVSKEVTKDIEILRSETFAIRSHQTSKDDRGMSIFELSNGDIVQFVNVDKGPGIFNQPNIDIVMKVFSKNGSEKQSYSIISDPQQDWVESVVKVDDGFVIGYRTLNNTSNSQVTFDFGAAKVSNSGTILWKTVNELPQPYNNKQTDEFLWELVKVKTGFALCGHVVNVNDGSSKSADGYIVWLSETGKYLDKHILSDGPLEDIIYGACEADNGDLIMIGRSLNKTPDSHGFFVRMNSNKDILINESHGGTKYDGFFEVIRTTDNNYLVSGYTLTKSINGKHDFWIIKLDKNGKELWSDVQGSSGDDYVLRMIELDDAYYGAAGLNISYTPPTSTPALLKINKANGSISTKKLDQLGSGQCYFISSSNDCNIITSGYTVGGNSNDAFIIKTNTNY